MPDPCPHCLAARAALDAAPSDPADYLRARGWTLVEGLRDWWRDPLGVRAADRECTPNAVDEQRRRDALVIAGVRLGMERAAGMVKEWYIDRWDDTPPRGVLLDVVDAIRAALPATPVRLLDAEAVRRAVDAQRDVDASCSAWEALDGVLRALGLGGERG